MRRPAVKHFTVDEGSTEGMWYEISVYDHKGVCCCLIIEPTMKAARQQLLDYGFDMGENYHA
jgi:hypothetical protein